MDRLLGAGGRQLAWMRHAGIEHAVEELQLRIECHRNPRDFVRLDQADVDRRWDGEHYRLPDHISLLVLWLVRSDGGLEDDAQAIPGIDRDDREREIDDLLARKVPLQLAVRGIVVVVFRDERHAFGEGQGSALALAEERCLPPGRESIEALFRLAAGTGILR